MTSASYHLARAFPDRNCDRVTVFANGHVYDRAERRESIRACIRVARRAKARRF